MSPFRFFAGTTNPYPVAIFRASLYCGIALHFWPSLYFFTDNYTAESFRDQQWSEWLFELLPVLPASVVYTMALVFMAANILGIFGLLPRTAAILTFAGTYCFASFNSIHLQTLALSSVWAALPLLAISGTGSEALSLRNLFSKRALSPAKQWAVGLLLMQLLIGFFFAGLEKLIANWPFSNEMWLLMNYPHGFIIRDWIAAVPVLQGEAFGYFLSTLTLFIEFLTPVFILWRRSRLVMLVIFQLFFIGVVAALEVPPLFWFIYAPGGLLVLDDVDFRRIRSLLGLRNPSIAPNETDGAPV